MLSVCLCAVQSDKTIEWKDTMVLHEGYEVRVFYVCKPTGGGGPETAMVALKYKGKSNKNQIRECMEGELSTLEADLVTMKNPPEGRPHRGDKKVGCSLIHVFIRFITGVP